MVLVVSACVPSLELVALLELLLWVHVLHQDNMFLLAAGVHAMTGNMHWQYLRTQCGCS